MLLPPCQFQKTVHRLPFTQAERNHTDNTISPATLAEVGKHEFLSFMGHSGENAEFLVDPESERYRILLTGQSPGFWSGTGSCVPT